jgi:hypothetical protein
MNHEKHFVETRYDSTGNAYTIVRGFCTPKYHVNYSAWEGTYSGAVRILSHATLAEARRYVAARISKHS